MPTTHEGIDGLIEMPGFDDIAIVFDATTAASHAHHDAVLRRHGKQIVDLTPAAIGPYVVPAVNLDQMSTAPNVNMVTCGGQATIPIVAAVNRVAPVQYAEIVASIASKSAGPGTRANIDEFTQTTARAIERVGGASRGKADHRSESGRAALDHAQHRVLPGRRRRSRSDRSVDRPHGRRLCAAYVPGFRLKQAVQFEEITAARPVSHRGVGTFTRGSKVTVFLEVEGAGHYLPAYAGNLDIMTSAALRTGERLAAGTTR